MSNTKLTKHALIVSIMAMLLCVAMLVGTTFAWFTDTASTAVNKIQAGTLDIQLLMYNGTEYDDISNNDKPIFGTGSIAQNNNAETLWEPGKTQVAYLAIKNNGNLALKYKVVLDVTNVANDLYEVMEYAITPDATNTNPVTAWTSGSPVVVGTRPVSGDVSLPVGATHYFALSIHMKEEAGNNYQNGEVDFDLTVLATQDTVENDSYDNTYDTNSQYPVISNTDLADAIQNATAGDTVVLASGNFELTGTIGEGVTIAGNGAENTVVVTEATGYALENDNITMKNLTVDGTAASGVYYAGAINLKGNNATIEDSVISGGGTGTWGASVYVNLGAGETAYIRNTKISGGFRGIFLGSQSGSIVVDNCDIDAVYPINVDGGGNFTVSVSNSKLHGWTSYAQITKATFTDTEFSTGASGYDVVAAYTDTTFTNCTFDSSFKVYAQAAGFNFVFNNCAKDGTPVTAENFKTLFPDDSDVWTKCTCTVNGVQVTA